MEDVPGLGPFIITEFIIGKTLDTPGKENPPKARSGLRADIDGKVQENVCQQLADIFLELGEHKFDRIGSLTYDMKGSYSVTVRLLTLKMNEIARVRGVFTHGKLIEIL